MSGVGPWLLAVVEGPSEAGSREAGGAQHSAIKKLVEPVFGSECAAAMDVVYWRELKLSPRRQIGRSRRGFAPRAAHAARLGRLTACGVLLLVDNDRDDRQDRLAELRRGAHEAGASRRAAVGVAREMLEAWLLADPGILENYPGKSCEELWGEKRDPESNFPKHVLRRCVLEPRGWHVCDVIAAWDPARARAHAPSLDAFMNELESLAGSAL